MSDVVWERPGQQTGSTIKFVAYTNGADLAAYESSHYRESTWRVYLVGQTVAIAEGESATLDKAKATAEAVARIEVGT